MRKLLSLFLILLLCTSTFADGFDTDGFEAGKKFNWIKVGGGYGNTGCDIENDGDIFTDGAFTVGAISATSMTVGGGYGSTGITMTAAGNLSMNGDLIVDGTAQIQQTTTIWTGLDIGDATHDCDTNFITAIKGAQAGDPQVDFSLSADANGDFGITTDTGDVTITAQDDLFLVSTGNLTQFTLPAAGKVYVNGTSTANTGTAGALDVDVTSLTNNNSAIDVSATNTAVVGNTAYASKSAMTSSAVVTGTSQNLYGSYNTATKTGADTSVDTTTLYGTYSSASNTGSTDAGTKNTYAGYFTATGDANGTATAYGIYATVTGADTNWAGYFNGATFVNGALSITSMGQDWTNAARTIADLGIVTTVDINGGTIDGVTIGGAVAGDITGNTITANTNFVPDADNGAGLGLAGTAFSDLFLAEGAVINWDSSDATITQTGDTLAFGGSTLIDIQTGILELNNAVRFDTGVAIVAGSYSIGRDADGTNQLHSEVPDTASFEWSSNDVPKMTLTSGAAAQTVLNLITTPAINTAVILRLTNTGASNWYIGNAGNTNSERFQIGNNTSFGTSLYYLITSGGKHAWLSGAATSGAVTSFDFTVPDNTGITAATNNPQFSIGSSTQTWAAGAGPLAVYNYAAINAPTLVGNAGGALTISRADTVSISGAPIAGASMTLTEANALYVGGQMRLDSQLRWGAGVAVTAGQYSIGRDADATNQLHFNVPTGATFEWSINDVALSVWDFAAASGDIDAAYQLTFVAQDSSHNNYPTLLVGEASTYGIGIQANNATYDIPTIQLGYSNSGGALDLWNYRSWQATNTNDMLFTTKGTGNSAVTRLTITGNVLNSAVTIANSLTTISSAAGTSGVPTTLTVTGAAHTGLTAATEDIGANFNFSATKTWAAGAGPLGVQREVAITAPNYVGDVGGALTITDAYTFYVSGAPTQGANMTLTRPWAAGFNGNIGVGNGTVALPSLAFISDPNTGIYLGGTDRLSLVAGGSEIIKIETDRVSVTATDGVTITQRNQNTPETLLTLTPFAVANSDASTERTYLSVAAATQTWNTGALANQRYTIFDGSTAAFVASSTITNFANVFIDTPNTGNNALVTTLNALQVGGAATINQVAGTLYGAIGIPAHTITLGNTTQITSSGMSGLSIGQVTLTQAGATTVDNFASLYIAGAGIAGDAAVITNNYALWADAGNVRFDGILQQNDAIYFTQTDGNEKIDSAADGYLDFTVTTAHRFNMSAADTDIRLEFVGTTNSGLLEWMEDEDYFRFSDSIFMVRGIIGKQGTDIASGSTIVIPTDGNTFELTGVTAVDLITSTGYQDGFTITLIANENVTINHGTATAGANITILLAGAGNFAMTANDTLTLVLSSTTAGGQAWREVSRTAI